MKGQKTVTGNWDEVSEEAEKIGDKLDEDQEDWESWRPEKESTLKDTQKETVDQQSSDGIFESAEKIFYSMVIKTNPCLFEGEEIVAVLSGEVFGEEYVLKVTEKERGVGAVDHL